MKNIIFITTLFFCCSTQAQDYKKDLKKGNKFFNEYAYFNAIKIYEKVANNGYKSVELYEKLGDANFFNGHYIEANNWYKKLFELNKDVETIYYFRYAQTLKAIGDYKKSNLYMDRFAAENQQNDIAIIYSNNSGYLKDLSKDNHYYIQNLGFNTHYSDFETAIYNGDLLFSSTRDSNKRVDPRTNEYVPSLYGVKHASANDTVIIPEPFIIKNSSKYNESVPIFSKDGMTMYFTKNTNRNRNSNGKKAELKIVTATQNRKGKWKKIRPLSVNSDLYNCAHPALSPDEKTLYFVSDMPGGFGNTDIYKVNLENHKTTGSPVNLGSAINTSQKESYPFVDKNNNLYFASNGLLGLGGLDIFKASSTDKEYSATVNLARPINSAFDDFAYLKLSACDSGYFSSNRPGGKGKDDIYYFEQQKDTIINFDIIDQETQKPLENLTISVYDQDHKLLVTGYVSSEGRFIANIEKNADRLLYIEVNAPEYGKQEVIFDKRSLPGSASILSIPKTLQKLNIGKDLSDILIQSIYFSVDSFELRSDAEVELQKLVEFMKDYPGVSIEIRAHTDSRLSKAFNMELSKKRAQAVKKYVVTNGINASRLKTRGYGETQLLNQCVDGVPCTETEHQKNRRCEFIITKL